MNKTNLDKIVFGNKNQPFFELSPLFYCPFKLLNNKWNSLMHFFIVMSVPDLMTQYELMKISNLQELIKVASKCGFKNIDVLDKELLLRGIYEAFTQDSRRSMILMSTGSAELIYNAPKSYLTENNRYGKILMRMRHIIAEEDKDEVE